MEYVVENKIHQIVTYALAPDAVTPLQVMVLIIQVTPQCFNTK